MELLSRQIREARVGDLVKAAGAGRVARGLEATAIVVPGASGLGPYADGVESRRADFAAWDGRVVILPGDGEPEHLVAIVDRYGQVYEKTSTPMSRHFPIRTPWRSGSSSWPPHARNAESSTTRESGNGCRDARRL